MLERWIRARLERNIKNSPAVALLGPRQVGKTTLAQRIAHDRPSLYLDLESPEDLFKLNDPISFLSTHADKLVILDEIQRAPELFKVLRGLIDKQRSEGRPVEQFLLLGSASMDLLRQSSESLAGRISYLEMGGLNTLEIQDNDDQQKQLWLRGGFPNSFLAVDNELSLEWRENFIRTYLERDVPQMGFRVPADRLRRLWTMLAHLQGEPVNQSQLGGNLEIDGKTVSHYIDILVDLLLVRRLEPWHVNTKKRLVKSPRFYIRDTGIQHRLLGINNMEELFSSPILGKSWEGFVIENIHSILPRHAETYFYRTSAGAEIDLVIRLSSKDIWAIEIKFGTAPKISKHFNETCNDISATKKWVVYSGDDTFSIGNEVNVISLRGIMALLLDHLES